MKAAQTADSSSVLRSEEMGQLEEDTGRIASQVASPGDRPAAEQLHHLSAEVGRIASKLAQMSMSSSATAPSVAASGASAPSAKLVREIIRARRMRAQFFPEELFADPAWDMLLDLFQAELAQLRVSVSSLCIAAAVPPTTGLRWLSSLVRRGMLVRHADPFDGRRIFVELSPETSDALRRYFHEIGQQTVI